MVAHSKMKSTARTTIFPFLMTMMKLLTLPGVFGQSSNSSSSVYLQILHSSDQESSFQDPNTLEEKIIYYSALVQGLQQLAAQEHIPSLHLTAGDHTIPGPFYLASTEIPAYNQSGLGDIAIYNAFPNLANGMGNHEVSLCDATVHFFTMRSAILENKKDLFSVFHYRILLC